MTTEEIAVKIEGHAHEIRALKHRMDNQEEESKSIQQLGVCVVRIAFSTEYIMQEEVGQRQRLEKLEEDQDNSHDGADHVHSQHRGGDRHRRIAGNINYKKERKDYEKERLDRMDKTGRDKGAEDHGADGGGHAPGSCHHHSGGLEDSGGNGGSGRRCIPAHIPQGPA